MRCPQSRAVEQREQRAPCCCHSALLPLPPAPCRAERRRIRAALGDGLIWARAPADAAAACALPPVRRGQHVHTECLHFHACIAAAAGDQVDAESLVRDNPELRDKAISEALETVCDECGQAGASVEIECSRGSRSKKTRLHLPCAHVRGNEIRGLGDGNYPKTVLPLPQDEVGDDEADGADKGEDDGRGEDDLSAGEAHGAVPREADESPSRQSPSHAQADSHVSAPGGADDHDNGIERSLDSEEQGGGGADLDSDGDSANRSTTLGKRRREEGGGDEESERDDDDDVAGEDEGQVRAENVEAAHVPVRREELPRKLGEVYDVVAKVVKRHGKNENWPDVQKNVDELYRKIEEQGYKQLKHLQIMSKESYEEITESCHWLSNKLPFLDKLKASAGCACEHSREGRKRGERQEKERGEGHECGEGW